jgi:hypothetical protein
MATTPKKRPRVGSNGDTLAERVDTAARHARVIELANAGWTRDAQIDKLHETLWPHTLHVLRDNFGSPILDANGEEQLVPNLPVIDRVHKNMDRKARLCGLDLQPGVQVGVITREALAGVLWVEDGEVLEGEAEEIVELPSGDE